MSVANTDIESLVRAQRELVDFRAETERFWRAANYSFDILEDELARVRANLARQAEEAGARTVSGAAGGDASEISRMLYEDEYGGNRSIAELEEKIERLRVLEAHYADSRDAFLGDMRALLQDGAGADSVQHGMSTLINLLEDYLGR